MVATKLKQEKILKYTIKVITELAAQKSSLALIDSVLTELIKLPVIELVRMYEVHHAQGGTISSLMDAKHLLFKEMMEKPWQAKDVSEPPNILAHSIVKNKPIIAQSDTSEASVLAYPLVPLITGLTRVLYIESKNEELSQVVLESGVFEVLQNLFELFDLLERDQLTGFFNQNLLSESLVSFSNLAVQFNQQANRSGDKAWLTIFDIEGLKQLKQEQGVLYCDDAILVISYIIKCCFRSSDLLFRYQGGCFVSLLVCDDESEIICALNRLHQDLSSNWPTMISNEKFHIAFTFLGNNKPSIIAIEELQRTLQHMKDNKIEDIASFETLEKQGLLAPLANNDGDIELF